MVLGPQTTKVQLRVRDYRAVTISSAVCLHIRHVKIGSNNGSKNSKVIIKHECRNITNRYRITIFFLTRKTFYQHGIKYTYMVFFFLYI